MVKFKVVRYGDACLDEVIATCNTKKEAEKICNKYRRKHKLVYNYLVIKKNKQ